MQTTPQGRQENRAIRTKRPMHYSRVEQSFDKQVKMGDLRHNNPSDFVFILPTTSSYKQPYLTTLCVTTANGTFYYVNHEQCQQLFPKALSFDQMREKLLEILNNKCTVTYESPLHALSSVQKHFHIDQQLINKAKKHQICNKLRGFKIKQLGTSYKRQNIIQVLGLGNNELNKINGEKTVKLWLCRTYSRNYVSLLLAWSMMSTLAMQYLTFYCLWKYEDICKRTVHNWDQRLQDLKTKNAERVAAFAEGELGLELTSSEVQSILASL